jgi:preprotein translocase subunit SecD
MTGAQLSSVGVSTDPLGAYVINFELKPEGAQIFREHTTANVRKILGIVLDKTVISTPVINSPITEGQGIIQGDFTVQSANALAIQLRYGSLPVPLEMVESRIIGPTLGQDSLNKSMLAGVIGFGLVILFMIIYYRLPGALAIAAILNYGLIVLALFKLIPVTLTLPGIAGFLLSTGGALDANILMFERLKEELRGGRNLRQAVDLAWKRAWPSIRDSNVATLITSLILFWFGSAYGATIVKGFALTLALGMAVSLLSAIFVTRTLLAVSVDLIKPENHYKWFGA